jgi:hypothetical protein
MLSLSAYNEGMAFTSITGVAENSPGKKEKKTSN